MGLLDRARTLDENIALKETDDPVGFARSVVGSLRHSPDHIDYPAGVFKAFKSLIGFSKGSLMLPDYHGKEFYPWITVGFDRTTTRRLRIPFDFKKLNNNDSILIDNIAAGELTQMLSNRENGLSSRILIIKMNFQDIASALLFTTDCPWIGKPDSEMLSAIQILADEFEPGIRKSRMTANPDSEEEISGLSEWLDSWGAEKATLVTLDITNAINALVNVIPGLELYRGRRDVINLIRHITGRMGRFHDLKDGRVLVLFPPNRLPDHDLYLHQLSRSFASAFLDLSIPPEFPAEFRSWPDEKDEVRKSLSGFF